MLSLSTAAANQILQDYKSSRSINSYYQILAEFNMNAYYFLDEVGVIKSTDNQRIPNAYDYDYIEQTNDDLSTSSFYFVNLLRVKYGNISSIFSPQRPNIGIIRPFIAYANIVNNVRDIYIQPSGSPTVTAAPVTIYPFSENSRLDYWSSARTGDGGTKYGISDRTFVITDSNPYAQYKEKFYTNKITINLQNYYAFPTTGSVYLESAITPIYYFDTTAANSPFKDGNFNLYYDYSTSTWTTASSNNTIVSDFRKTSNQFVSASYIALKVNKLSTRFSDMQVVEISPRLFCDLSKYAMSFEHTSAISSQEYGLPVGSLENSVGTIELSDVDMFFSKNSTNSVLSNLLNPNVKFNINQVVKKTISGTEYTEYIPIKTMYSNSWLSSDNKTTQIQLEDYTKFFKETESTDLVFAMKGGIKVDEAIKRLLENAGFSRKNVIVKTNANNNVSILKYFYSRKENSVAQTLEQIALSTQYSIFFDANNKLNILTKEYLSESVDSNSASWWMMADPQKSDSNDPEYSIINSSSWQSNIISFSEEKSEPITDLRVNYTGVNIPRSPYAALASSDIKEIVENNQLGAPILSRDLRYTNRVLWQAEKDTDDFNGYLLAGVLKSTIPPSSSYSFGESSTASVYRLDSLKTFQPTVVAKNEYDAVRTYYKNISINKPTYLKNLKIELDLATMQIYLSAKAFSGYFIVDNETIKYNGMIFRKMPFNGTETEEVYFTHEEYLDVYNSLPSRSNLIPIALLLDLTAEKVENTSSQNYFNQNTASFKIINYGRGVLTYGSAKPKIQEHSGTDSRDFNKYQDVTSMFSIKVLSTSFNCGTNKPSISLSQEIKAKDSITSNVDTISSSPGFLTIKGPTLSAGTDLLDSLRTSASVDDLQFYDTNDIQLYGYKFNKNYINFTPHYISARIRTVDKGSQSTSLNTSAGAGIFFGLNNLEEGSPAKGKSNTTGFFLEIDDYGRVENLIDENTQMGPTNFNLYYIQPGAGACSGSLVTTKLNGKTKRVSVVSAPTDYTSPQLLSTSPDNFVNTSDIQIFLNHTLKTIKVLWQGNTVIDITTPGLSYSGSIGFFVKGNSEALIDHFFAARSPNENDIYVKIKSGQDIFFSNPRDFAAQCSQYNWTKYYDDFGCSIREVKKVDARFKSPALKSQLIDISQKTFDYSIKEYSSNAFGADFWIENNSSDVVLVAENAVFPLMITGIPLLVGEGDRGVVTFRDLVGTRLNEKIAGEEIDNTKFSSKITNLKRIYGEKIVDMNGEYIVSRTNALDLAKWILNNNMQEKRTISLEIYANPLLELGDKVKLFYKTNNYTQNIFGDKSFIISSINYSITESGPKMNIIMQELT